MRRAAIADVPAEFSPPEEKKRTTKTFAFELITPMFGGGAESWKLDSERPVRAQGIKGQLRFWWRTMQTITDPRELLRKENALFGGKTDDETRIKSPVSIAVTERKRPCLKQAEMENDYAVKGDDIPKYVLFPITDKVKKGETVHFVLSYSFNLTVSYPHQCEEKFLRTLKLWCLFGGVGARTRRGCGSLYCGELMEEFTDKQRLYDFVKGLGCNSGADKHDAPYPQFSNSILALSDPQGTDAAHVWRDFLNSYGNFRQGPGCGRRSGQPRPGRSFWPEPDSLREICGNHEERHVPEHPDRNWFPRAAYGLPIIFKFIDGQDPGRGQQINLQPGNAERWPSPMILKVIRLANDETVKCCLVLNAAPPNEMELGGPGMGKGYNLVSDEMPLTHKGLAKEMKTNDPLRNDENPYTALVRFLRLEVGA